MEFRWYYYCYDHGPVRKNIHRKTETDTAGHYYYDDIPIVVATK